MGNAVNAMGPAHGGEWEHLSFSVPQALQPHLVLGQSILVFEFLTNKTKCHSPPIFLRKSSFVVVLNNSLQKYLSFFFFLTLIQLNRKIPQHRHCLRTRSPEMIKGQPFLPRHLNLIGFSCNTPRLFFQIS